MLGAVASTQFRAYRRLVPSLRPYRVRLVGVLAAACAGPVLLAARIWLLKTLIDTVLRGHQLSLLPAVVGGYVAIAVVRAGLQGWAQTGSARIGAGMVRDLRVALYGRLQQASLAFLHRHRLGDLLTRLSGDITAIEDLLVSGLTTLITHVVTVGLFLALLVYLDPPCWRCPR